MPEPLDYRSGPGDSERRRTREQRYRRIELGFRWAVILIFVAAVVILGLFVLFIYLSARDVYGPLPR